MAAERERSADVRAGRVGRPHGLDGAFRVELAVPGLLEPGRHVRVGGRRREIIARGGDPARPIARLAGVVDRDGAAALRGADLVVPRAEAPALGADEWWAVDLIGCCVVDRGREVGAVRALVALPSCEALAVEPAEGGDRELLVPLVRDAVRSVDVAGRRIEVDLGFLGEA